ncbi:MAG TPA: hypothetical protein VHJ78_07950 [Actinomycetota bacterium]|nr:hypothetical protein [Actinomycetota bacterium]
MGEANRERLKAYGYLLLFVGAAVGFGYYAADTVERATLAPLPAGPLLIGAVTVSLLTILPLVITFRPSAAGSMLAVMREKARRQGKTISFQSVSRTVSLYVAALASTPVLYGIMLQFLAGDFQLLLLLLPAVGILALVGWFVLSRFFQELATLFLR